MLAAGRHGIFAKAGRDANAILTISSYYLIE